MTINIKMTWPDDHPYWKWFSETQLAHMPEGLPAKAVCKYPLFLISGNKVGVIGDTKPLVEVGTIAFTAAGLREILGVTKLSRTLRESRKTLITINKYLIDLQ